MITAQTNNSEKTLTLKQAAEKLNVSIEKLLLWNENNILKPTITQTGEIGYTQEQIDQFLTIRQLNNIPQSAPTKQQFQQTLPIKKSLPEDFAYVSFKRVSPRLMLSFAAIFSVLITGILVQTGEFKFLNNQNKDKVLATQTSKLKLPGQTISSLSIKTKNELALKETINHENESAFKEKSSTSALFRAKTEKNIAVKNQQGKILGSVASIGGQIKQMANEISNTYALSTVGTKDPCPTCTSNDDSAIDENGNIRGEISKTNNLVAIAGGIEEMVSGDSLKQTGTDSTNQLIFLFMTGLAAVFVFQRQLVYAGNKKLQAVPVDFYNNRIDTVIQKVLEVDQKTDGTVMLYFLGKEYKISKPELYSESDRFIEELMTLVKPSTKEIEYDVLRYGNTRLTTPLSRLVTRLGFVGIKRDLFFPRTSKHRVLFRKYLTQQDLTDMGLTNEQVLTELGLSKLLS